MSGPQPVVAAESHDTHDLARFGYKQELHRRLGVFSSFAVAFSYISPSTGIFTLYALGLATIGGVFFWSWPIVALGQFIIALNFAEVSTQFPVAGSVFQWTKYLAPKPYAWFTGWIYLFAGALTTTAVVVTLPLALIPAFEDMGFSVANTLNNQRIVALITLVVITLLNIFGVRLVSIINNTGVIFEVLGMLVFAIVLAVLHHHQSLAVVTNPGTTTASFGGFMAAMFMSLFVIYGFDTASTLAEETRDPRRAAPLAVLMSVAGAFAIGVVFLLATLVAIPNLKTAIADGWGPANIISAALPGAMATVYLVVVSAAIFVCCLSIQASTIRLAFGMARDRQIPLAHLWSTVNQRTGSPFGACLLIAVLAGIPLLQFAGAGYIAIAATGMIYLTYLLGNLAVLHVRLKGQWRPRHDKHYFSLGRWGTPINVLGIIWGAAMLINFAWPRAASNPTPAQTVIGNVQAFSWGPLLDHVPVLYTVAIGIVVLGAIYYAIRHQQIPTVVRPTMGSTPVEGG